MKPTNDFKNIIQSRLNEMALNDKLFAESLKKENKNIDDCITYIFNTVKSSGCNGFSDDEIFGMAAHYYDEDDIKVGGKVNCKVVVNHSVELTEEEKAQAKEEAKKEAYSDEVARQKEKLTRKVAKAKNKPEEPNQATLF